MDMQYLVKYIAATHKSVAHLFVHTRSMLTCLCELVLLKLRRHFAIGIVAYIVHLWQNSNCVLECVFVKASYDLFYFSLSTVT